MEEKVLLTLTTEEMQNLLDRAAEIGAQTGIKKYNEEIKANKKKRIDRRIHNTKLLLRNYRMLKENAENSVFGRTQMNESAADILESMMNVYNDELIIESIRNTATRTAIIVSHVRTMIDIFKVCCEKSANEIDVRRYDVLYSLYMADDKVTRKELAAKWCVSLDTTYTDEKVAIERLSALIFGVDGLNFL